MTVRRAHGIGTVLSGNTEEAEDENKMIWDRKHLAAAKDILRRYPRSEYQEAVAAIAKATRREVTGSALRSVFLREGFGPPTSFMREPEEATKDVNEVEEDTPDVEAEHEESESLLKPTPNLKKFIELTRKGPTSFHLLCDRLHLPPGKVFKLIEEAKKLGVRVHVEHDHVGIRFPETSEDHLLTESIKPVGVAPVVGKRQKIAVISDTHLGSKYCLREQLKDFIHYAYEQGVREIVHPGDVLDGCYRHGLWEVSHSGLDEQTRDLFETLPRLPGLHYHCITGNHDFTFTEQIGADIGDFVEAHFRAKGRNDIHFHGNRSAFLKLRGAVVHLWHPKKGMGYARSYAVQKQIEKYSSGEKPAILLVGHWHTFVYCMERGVHGIACPTFQGGGSAFSKSLGGAPSIGGLVLSWELTEHGTMRGFNLEYRAYFEREKLVVLDFDESRA